MKLGHSWPLEKLAASAPSKGLGSGLAAAVVVVGASAESVTVDVSMTTSVVVAAGGVSLGAATRRRRSPCSSSDMICQWPSTKTGIRVSISNVSGSDHVAVLSPVPVFGMIGVGVGRREAGEIESAAARQAQKEIRTKITALCIQLEPDLGLSPSLSLSLAHLDL